MALGHKEYAFVGGRTTPTMIDEVSDSASEVAPSPNDKKASRWLVIGRGRGGEPLGHLKKDLTWVDSRECIREISQ
jgi:hypothetical protein